MVADAATAAMPEAAELYRPDPDLSELIEEASPPELDQTAESNADFDSASSYLDARIGCRHAVRRSAIDVE